jgi:hypothetical protein
MVSLGPVRGGFSLIEHVSSRSGKLRFRLPSRPLADGCEHAFALLALETCRGDHWLDRLLCARAVPMISVTLCRSTRHPLAPCMRQTRQPYAGVGYLTRTGLAIHTRRLTNKTRRSCERRGYFLVGYSLVATADSADRAVVALDRDSAASAISAIITVGAISGSIVVAIVAWLRAHSHAADRCINGNLS